MAVSNFLYEKDFEIVGNINTLSDYEAFHFEKKIFIKNLPKIITVWPHVKTGQSKKFLLRIPNVFYAFLNFLYISYFSGLKSV